MFDNIGYKIKVAAKVFFALITICSVIGAIILIVNACRTSGNSSGVLLGTGIGLLFVGPLFAWLSTMLIYGFGELIESNSVIAAKICKDEKPSLKETRKIVKKDNELSNSIYGYCDDCGKSSSTLYKVEIKDEQGIRYRKVCKECLDKLQKNN